LFNIKNACSDQSKALYKDILSQDKRIENLKGSIQRVFIFGGSLPISIARSTGLADQTFKLTAASSGFLAAKSVFDRVSENLAAGLVRLFGRNG
jgi:hypothetical protein